MLVQSSAVAALMEQLHSSFMTRVLAKAEVSLGEKKKWLIA